MFNKMNALLKQCDSENPIEKKQAIYLLQEALYNLDGIEYVSLLSKEELMNYQTELQSVIHEIEKRQLFEVDQEIYKILDL